MWEVKYLTNAAANPLNANAIASLSEYSMILFPITWELWGPHL
jgi:hypothetical protein